MSSEKVFKCPECGGQYKKQNTVDRHLKFGCPDKTKSAEIKEEKGPATLPDFDKMLSDNEPEISDKTAQEFVDNIDFFEDEEGNPKIHVSEFINNSAFLESSLEMMDEKMYNTFMNRTGNELWNPTKRDMERGIFIWLLKVNLRSMPIAISPLWALAGFGSYFYLIPITKLIKSKRVDINERRENQENED